MPIMATAPPIVGTGIGTIVRVAALTVVLALLITSESTQRSSLNSTCDACPVGTTSVAGPVPSCSLCDVPSSYGRSIPGDDSSACIVCDTTLTTLLEAADGQHYCFLNECPTSTERSSLNATCDACPVGTTSVAGPVPSCSLCDVPSSYGRSTPGDDTGTTSLEANDGQHYCFLNECPTSTHWQKAEHYFEHMAKHGIQPDTITHSALMSAMEKGSQYSHRDGALDRHCLPIPAGTVANPSASGNVQPCLAM